MLTINDVEKYKFGSAMFGYSRADVDKFASLVVESMQHYVDEIEALKKRIAGAEAEIERYRASEATLRDSIVLAQKSHDEIIGNAQKEAENILAAARVKTVELAAKHAEVTAARERFEYEFYGLLKGFIQTLAAPRYRRLCRGIEGRGRRAFIRRACIPGGESSLEPVDQNRVPAGIHHWSLAKCHQ